MLKSGLEQLKKKKVLQCKNIVISMVTKRWKTLGKQLRKSTKKNFRQRKDQRMQVRHLNPTNLNCCSKDKTFISNSNQNLQESRESWLKQKYWMMLRSNSLLLLLSVRMKRQLLSVRERILLKWLRRKLKAM